MYRIGGRLKFRSQGLEESLVGYHSLIAGVLTWARDPGQGQCLAGSLTGGRLPKSNGGAQRFPQRGWKSREECKGIRELDCERDISSRDESRA